MFNVAEYTQRINYLSESLLEKMTEDNSSLSQESIEMCVSRVMSDFQHRLSTDEKIKINFIAIPIGNWDFLVLNPLVKITQIECTHILKERCQGEQKRADQEVPHRVGWTEKDWEKIHYYQKLSSRKDDDSDSDNDSLHLDDDKPI